jgi:putative ABC transport system permease protein
LSPFSNIAKIVDLMTIFVKVMLIAIVLISILNVMIMAVYERVREIGTIAAIGTLPAKFSRSFWLKVCFSAWRGRSRVWLRLLAIVRN